MVKVVFLPRFKQVFSKVKDKKLKEQIIKQISKIKTNPTVGKPQRNARKGTRELYIKPYRLSYAYHIPSDTVFILDLYHKKKQ
jgi:mRNA-degrading endonuclease RelE of RelBE toxin-antitoxin system